MIKKEFLWTEKNGMHARPAGMIVEKASKFNSEITISNGGKLANAKGLFALMGLGVECGAKIGICFEGDDEEKASQEMTEFLKENFASEA